MTDATNELHHDHRELNRHVLMVGGALRALHRDAGAHDQLLTELEELSELLYTHFAREEEGLFPYIGSSVPDLADSANAMATVHDAICGALARSLHLARTGAAASAIGAAYERFENAYASHAALETMLLDDLSARLDAEQRAELLKLLQAL